MYPLQTEMKTRRLHWGGKSSTQTWMFYKFLKEDDDTRRVLDVNPCAEVFQFRENLYGILSDNLDGKGDVWSYLIIGPQKAMLIDTSYGLGDQKGLVDTLTGGMELIVVNTHDHYDHAYGNCRFEKVYCHEHLVPYLKNQHAHMWDYVFDALGNPIWVDFDPKDLPVFKPYEIIGVPDGYTWNLGEGYEVELIFTGGHCTGHAAFLDKKSRLLFSGDNLCTDTCSVGDLPHWRTGEWAEDGDMDICRDRFKVLVERMDEYDYVFPQHHINDLDKSIIYNTWETMNRILEAPEDYDYMTVGYGKDRNQRDIVCYKNIPGFSAIRYKYDREKWARKGREKA